MASVHKRKESKFWWGSFWHEGKKIFRSTGLEDRAKALQVALAWEESLKGPIDSQEQARKVMSDLLSKVLGADRGRMNCRDYCARWLAAIKGTVAPATLGFYKGTLDAWQKWLGDRAGRSLAAIQRQDIVEWRTAEAERVSTRTANNRLKAVRVLFRAAVSEGYANSDPTDGLKSLKAKDDEERKRRPFTKEELTRVLAACGEPWKIMTLAGLQTGQRLGDIARMKWADVDFARKHWSVTTRKMGHGLRIPLSADLLTLLTARRAAAGEGPHKAFVFPEMTKEIAKSTDGYVGGLSKQFAHVLWQAGLRAVNPYGRRTKKAREDGGAHREQHELSFHSLRHTARTWLEEAGEPKAVIDALIGHEGDTGKIYTTVGTDAMQKAADRLAQALRG